MGTEGNVEERMTTSEYLAQLLKDKKQLQSFPNAFVHLERILDDEIRRVRGNVFCISGSESLHLPEPLGPAVTLCEKIIIPTREFPEFNFIGRLLGPRGMTAKQLELDTGCKILVRGQGSMRDKQKEEQMKGKPKWEHLNEELHVLITVEDSRNRATVKLRRAVEEVRKLLVPVPECDDELKKRQLIELAILNGTYRGLNGINGINGIFVSAANGTAPPLGSNFLGTHMAIGPPFCFGPHELVMGQHVAMGPTMLPVPLKSSPDQAGAPILLASPPPPTPHHNPHHNPMAMYTGALTPLPSPGPITPIQSPGVMGGIGQPLLLPCSEGGLIYHFNPCMIPPHQTSPAYEYPLSPVHPTSFGLSVGH